jgi:hypothetical protein
MGASRCPEFFLNGVLIVRACRSKSFAQLVLTVRLIAAIEDPNIARRILDSLNLPARAPLMAKATGHPREPPELEDDKLFDQSAGGVWP